MQKINHIVDCSETEFSFDMQNEFSTFMIYSGQEISLIVIQF